MNRENLREFMPIITEFLDGKEIQFNSNISGWSPVGSIDFDYPLDRYRVKLEPLEGWVVGTNKYFGSIKESKEHAETHLQELIDDNNDSNFDDWRVFKMREVLDD